MFWILHLLACLFGFVWLLITIPLHMIYRAIKGPSGIEKWLNYIKCPVCKESIKNTATACKHCGSPVSEDSTDEKEKETVGFVINKNNKR